MSPSVDPSTFKKRLLRVFILGLLALSFIAPSATVLASDLVGGASVATSPELESVVPDVAMRAGILVTPDGRELWSRSADEQRAMASTTKIMTAVVVLENASLDETLTVSRRAVAIGESAAGLKPGDVLTVSDALDAMLVKSGNEAAQALAEHVGGTADRFVEMMNAKAAELGLTDTSFTNPHGLDAQGHHTTASELSILTRYAMSKDPFRRAVGLTQIDLDGDGGAAPLPNSNLLIGEYIGATGVKTGWTSRAGYCLVATATRNGVELTAVVLGASNENTRFDQARTLLDWGFEHYRPRILASAEETLGAVPVTDYLDVTVPALVAKDSRVPVFDLDGEIERSVTLDPGIAAPVAKGDRIGTLTLTQGSRMLAQVELVAGTDVPRPGVFERAWIGVVRAWRSVVGGQLTAEPVLP